MKEITPASLADIPQLIQLLTILFSQEKEFQPNLEKQSDALQFLINHSGIGCILVLRHGGEILDMVSLLFTIITACGRIAALLEDLIVHPQHRNASIGTMQVWFKEYPALRFNSREIVPLSTFSSIAISD